MSHSVSTMLAGPVGRRPASGAPACNCSVSTKSEIGGFVYIRACARARAHGRARPAREAARCAREKHTKGLVGCKAEKRHNRPSRGQEGGLTSRYIPPTPPYRSPGARFRWAGTQDVAKVVGSKALQPTSATPLPQNRQSPYLGGQIR